MMRKLIGIPYGTNMRNYQKMLLFTLIWGAMAACKRTEIPLVSNETNLKMIAQGSQLVNGISAPGDVVGKVTVGYQGWFSCPSDGGAINGWNHTNLETYPDLRQYTTTFSPHVFYQNGIQQAAFSGNLGNGTPARMFSSYTQQVSNVHCLWMKQNDIDCFALQRFGSYMSNPASFNFYNGVATHMKQAA